MMSAEIYIFDRAQGTKPFETSITGVATVLVRQACQFLLKQF
jgi:hypothetical protein